MTKEKVAVKFPAGSVQGVHAAPATHIDGEVRMTGSAPVAPEKKALPARENVGACAVMHAQ